ncbi:hypothetical protein [Pararhodonellum marinum]|uniref:hypothetical protein n=1 Tax=Pararhodonellum marinum TaxID=2755358 RepID=UPI00188F5D33|nr:hypothetical protein [Pararhodonellum marinum]
MTFRKTLLFIFVLSGFYSFHTQAQSKLQPIHVGVYHSGITGQVGIGSDMDKAYFGELRFSASDVLDYAFGIEGYFNKNLVRDDWYNIHLGLSLGYYFSDEVRLGIPIGMTFKPIQSNRNFGVLLEAMPNAFLASEFFNLRANIGLRYSFGKN